MWPQCPLCNPDSVKVKFANGISFTQSAILKWYIRKNRELHAVYKYKQGLITENHTIDMRHGVAVEPGEPSVDDSTDDEETVDNNTARHFVPPGNVRAYISGRNENEHIGYTNGSMLIREVYAQIHAHAIGQDITLPVKFVVFSRHQRYTRCSQARRNWAVQFLIDATRTLMAQPADPHLFIPLPVWGAGSLYDDAAAAGRYLILSTTQGLDGGTVSPLGDLSHVGRYAAEMKTYRDTLRPDLDTDVSIHTVNTKVYASATLFFVLEVFSQIFDADPLAVAIYRRSQLKNFQNAYANGPDMLCTHEQYVTQCFLFLDNIAQRYNIMTPLQTTGRNVRTIGMPPEMEGTVQIITAPRPWVLMQMIQMRLRGDLDPHNRSEVLV